MLSVLKHKSIDRAWRAIFEGALLEARVGRTHVARQFFKYLLYNISWYGPIYYEAFCLESRCGRYGHALAIVNRGLEALPRYGPLWFALLHIAEREDTTAEQSQWILGHVPVLRRLRQESHRAVQAISRELVWKVYFERALAEERAADTAAAGMFHSVMPAATATASSSSLPSSYVHSQEPFANTAAMAVAPALTLTQCRDILYRNARLSLIQSLLFCPTNLRWKIWLASSRLELSTGHTERSRKLLQQALIESPVKSKGLIYLECSRVEEYSLNVAAARRILIQACTEYKSEWRLYLELIMLEARQGRFNHALTVCRSALQLHAGAGRLWAAYVQLCHRLEYLADFNHSLDQLLLMSNNGNTTAAATTTTNTTAVSNSTPADTAATDDVWLVPSKSVILQQALVCVPKSGEVWCESARCAFNPLRPDCFHLSAVQTRLSHAIQYTPQCGDTFIEYMKMECIAQVLLPYVLNVLGVSENAFVKEFLCGDLESDTYLSMCANGSGDDDSVGRNTAYENNSSNTAFVNSVFNSTTTTATVDGTHPGSGSGIDTLSEERKGGRDSLKVSREERKVIIRALLRHQLERPSLNDALKAVTKTSLERR